MVLTQEKTIKKQLQMREIAQKAFYQMFEDVCKKTEEIDGKNLTEKSWNRDENNRWIPAERSEDITYIDRFFSNGNIFEKVGFNYVAIKGKLPPGTTFHKSGALDSQEADQGTNDQGTPFFATGASFVIHPRNPMVPTAHANYRYFEIQDGSKPGYWWFGGGADLTPAYLFDEDAVHFHRLHKEVCDRYDSYYYPRFKKGCDEYFNLFHRGQSRGIGGIFFDQLNQGDINQLFSFTKDCSQTFAPAYFSIVERRKDMPFTEQHKHWQRLVRGRYVEFILMSDRGFRFGLSSGMVNVQSIFNCMPPMASWEYDDQPLPNSEEQELKEVLQSPRQWV